MEQDLELNYKKKLGAMLLNIYHKSISKPNPDTGWKAGSGMINLIDALEQIGLDFSNVVLKDD
jgi:hypothetical protein